MPTIADAVRRTAARLAAAGAVAAIVVLGGGHVAGAHTDVDFTLPTDGAAVGEPVSEITIGFTQAVTLVGPGFEVLDPQGNVLTPFAATDDDQVFRLQLDPPLAGGDAAVRYEVRAQDGHTITGGFSFTISVDAPTTTTSTTTSTTTVATTTTVQTSSSSSTTAAVDTGASTTTERASSVAPPASVPGDGSDDESSILPLAAAGAVAIGAGAFLVIRSRSRT